MTNMVKTNIYVQDLSIFLCQNAFRAVKPIILYRGSWSVLLKSCYARTIGLQFYKVRKPVSDTVSTQLVDLLSFRETIPGPSFVNGLTRHHSQSLHDFFPEAQNWKEHC